MERTWLEEPLASRWVAEGIGLAADWAVVAFGVFLFWISGSHPSLMPVWGPWDFSPLNLSGDGAHAALVLSRRRARAAEGAAPGLAARAFRDRGARRLCRAADAVRILVAAHVFLEPRPARRDASLKPLPDRAELGRRLGQARHAALGARPGREPFRRRDDPCVAAACARGVPVRRAVLFLADPGGSFSRDDRRQALRGDELDHGSGRNPVLVPGSRSATLAAGARVLRRPGGPLARRHVPADPARRDHRLLVARPLSLLRSLRPSFPLDQRARRSAVRRPYNLDSPGDDERGRNARGHERDEAQR